MDELSILSQKIWMFMSACIIGVMAVSAVAVIAWWLMSIIKDFKKDASKETEIEVEKWKRQSMINAAAADAGWGNYIDKDTECKKAKETYEIKISEYDDWDAKKSNRIKKLEQQLRENGIDPIPWDKGEAA